MALNEGQIDYSVTDAETDMPSPADRAREQMEKLRLATPVMTKEEREDVVPGFVRGAVTSAPMAIADTFDLGEAATSWMTDDSLVGSPTAKGLRDSFSFLSDKFGREEATKLVKDVTGIELKDTPAERFGELLGIPGGGAIIEKMAAGVARGVDIKGSVNELRRYYESSSRGDDFGGMATEVAALTNRETPASRRANNILNPKLPDTSISPTMIGVQTEAGQKAVKHYEDLKSVEPDMSDKELFSLTGAYKGKDGKFRYELDTTDAQISPNFVGKTRGGEQYNFLKELTDPDTPAGLGNVQNDYIELSDIMDFDRLYQQYGDDLAEIEIRLIDDLDYDGAYLSSQNVIELNKTLLDEPDKVLSILLHEVQHAVQKIEGFSEGSNSSMFIPRAAKELGMPSIRNSRDIDRLSDDLSKKVDNSTDKFFRELNQKTTGEDIGYEGYPDETLASIFLTKHIMGKMENLKPYQFLSMKDPKYYKIDNEELDSVVMESQEFLSLPEDIQNSVAEKMFDIVNTFDEFSLAESFGDIVRYQKEAMALTEVEKRAKINYYRTYGELEANLVQERFAQVQKLKDEGYNNVEIIELMREKYPPVDFAIYKQIVDSADPEMKKLIKEYTTGESVSITPQSKKEGLFNISEDVSLAYPEDFAENIPSSTRRSEKPTVNATAEALEIGTNPATKDGVLLKNYDRSVVDDMTTNSKSATAGTKEANKIIDAKVDDGTQVGIRLNLNSSIPNMPRGLDKLQTLHKNNYNGKALSYKPFATVEDVTFNVSQKGRQGIAAKIKGIDVPEAKSKFPAMSVDGKYNNTRNILNEMDDDVVEIGLNPANGHLFVDMSTGQAVKGAEIATVIGDRVYAKGVKYMKKADAPKPLDASDGTPLPSEVRYKFKKGGVVL